MVFILTLKCDQASLLHSDAMDRQLRWHERMALGGHFLVCRVCRKLRQQLNFLGSANQYSTKDTPEIENCHLSPDALHRIRERLEEEAQEGS